MSANPRVDGVSAVIGCMLVAAIGVVAVAGMLAVVMVGIGLSMASEPFCSPALAGGAYCLFVAVGGWLAARAMAKRLGKAESGEGD